jgi:hypothetical protein
MVDFWEATRDILLVAVPTLIGALCSKFIINSWQVKKEEFDLKNRNFELRKQIFVDYENSFMKRLSIYDKFVSGVTDPYIREYKRNQDDKFKVGVMISFPKDEQEFPYNKFANEYNKFKKDIMENGDSIWKFFSTIRVYYNIEDIDIVMGQISKSNSSVKEAINLLMYSKELKEFNSNWELYEKRLTDFREDNHTLSHLLATTEFNKPIKKRSFLKKIKI